MVAAVVKARPGILQGLEHWCTLVWGSQEGDSVQLARDAGGPQLCLVSVPAEGTAVWSHHLQGAGSVWSAHTHTVGSQSWKGQVSQGRGKIAPA